MSSTTPATARWDAHTAARSAEVACDRVSRSGPTARRGYRPSLGSPLGSPRDERSIRPSPYRDLRYDYATFTVSGLKVGVPPLPLNTR